MRDNHSSRVHFVDASSSLPSFSYVSSNISDVSPLPVENLLSHEEFFHDIVEQLYSWKSLTQRTIMTYRKHILVILFQELIWLRLLLFLLIIFLMSELWIAVLINTFQTNLNGLYLMNPLSFGESWCRALLHEERPQHHGHKGNPTVTPETCDVIGERVQLILMWVRPPGVENASHPWRLGVMRVRPSTTSIFWHPDSTMLKNTSIGGVS
jgi:hypothetical protein